MCKNEKEGVSIDPRLQFEGDGVTLGKVFDRHEQLWRRLHREENLAVLKFPKVYGPPEEQIGENSQN